MLTSIITLILSLALLLWSANQLVMGSSGIARYYQIPTLFIGLTIVAIGTTAPEIMIAIAAAIEGKTNMAVGNAIGSNIANIGLVLGITAFIQPLHIQSGLLKREYPILFIIMLLAYILFIDGYLSRIDGLIFLFSSLALMIYFAFISQKAKKNDPFLIELKEALVVERSYSANVISILIGIILLPVSAKFLVNSAADIASWMGISELIIGLTVIAIGTSLPELATSTVAALKQEDDIAIGNILGSNMFNILLVIAFPGIINPDSLNRSVVRRDMPIMILLTVALFILSINQRKKMHRWHGYLLIIIYISYMVSLAV